MYNGDHPSSKDDYGVFQFDEDEEWVQNPGRRDRAQLTSLLWESAIALELLVELSRRHMDTLDYEDVTFILDSWPSDLVSEAVQQILDAAATLGWITDGTPGHDSWCAFLNVWLLAEDSSLSRSSSSSSSSSDSSDEGEVAWNSERVGYMDVARWRAGEEREGTTGGSESFERALGAEQLDTDGMGLTSHVSALRVGRVDPARFKTQVIGDLVHTHDGRFVIDSGKGTIRYLMSVEDGQAVLYMEQSLSESDARTVGGPGLQLYPVLFSHAQIDVDIICAGDLTIKAGKIVYIDNQSGSYQPTGKHLAAALRLTRKLGILGERTRFAQFISQPDGFDVDAGFLKRLRSAEVSAKLDGTFDV